MFCVLLTVHPCIILQRSPTRCTILLNIFISLLYMFRASVCLSSGENYCIYVTLVFVTLYEWRLVCRIVHLVGLICKLCGVFAYVLICGASVTELLGTNTSDQTASNLKPEIYVKEDLLNTLSKVNYFVPSIHICSTPSSVYLF